MSQSSIKPRQWRVAKLIGVTNSEWYVLPRGQKTLRSEVVDVIEATPDVLKSQETIEYLRKDSAAAWDKCEERRLENEEMREALQGIIEIGKRDLSNPKYNSYFEFAREVLAKVRGEKS